MNAICLYANFFYFILIQRLLATARLGRFEWVVMLRFIYKVHSAQPVRAEKLGSVGCVREDVAPRRGEGIRTTCSVLEHMLAKQNNIFK